MTHFNKYDIFHQQASFHLSMSSAVMSEAESPPTPLPPSPSPLHPPQTCCFPASPPSLTPTADAAAQPPPTLVSPPSMRWPLQPSALAHLRAYSAESNASAVLLARQPLFCTRAFTFTPRPPTIPPRKWNCRAIPAPSPVLTWVIEKGACKGKIRKGKRNASSPATSQPAFRVRASESEQVGI